MTKLADLTPLFEMTAAELRQLRFEEMLELRGDPLSRPAPAEEAAARTADYDRAARRHQVWLSRLLQTTDA
jgi:hypothetical protein